jgi:hypothetical protein
LCTKKSPVIPGLYALGYPTFREGAADTRLSDFGFFIKYVLANGRIVLFGLHLFGMQTLVLCHGVVVTTTSTGDEFDFVTHISFLRRLNALTVGTQVNENFLDTVLVDDAKALMRDTQTYETLLGFDPKTLELQIRA